ADIILLTGGMSQGDHDVVRPALASCCVRQIFWQGYWRPAKPLNFGDKDHTRIFGFPGNPVASFVGFRVFVQHMLGSSFASDLMGLKSARLASAYHKAPRWALFLRAQVDQDKQLILAPTQDSHQIFTLAQSNALCFLDTASNLVEAGSLV